MDKNNSLVKAQTASIQRVSKQLVIANKLLAERENRLLDWWNGLDDLWQDIFLINLECASKLKRETIEGMIDWFELFNIYGDYKHILGTDFIKPQKIKIEQLKEIGLLKELYCWHTEIPAIFN